MIEQRDLNRPKFKDGIKVVYMFAGRAASGDNSNADGLSSVVAHYLRKTDHQFYKSGEHLHSKSPNDYMELSF